VIEKINNKSTLSSKKMDLKRKKIIAKEIIIFSFMTVIMISVYVSLKIVNHNINDKRQVLKDKKLIIETELDSVVKLPWNLNWNKLIMPKVGLPSPPSLDILYSKTYSPDSSKIKNLIDKLESNRKEINKLSNLNTNQLVKKFCIILLIIIYPFRGLIYLLKWSIKTLND
jgi:hypothetical protein